MNCNMKLSTTVARKEVPPPCLSVRGQMNDSGHDSNTETEGRVLMTITDFDPPLPHTVCPVIVVKVTQPHTISISTRREPTYLYRGFSSTYSRGDPGSSNYNCKCIVKYVKELLMLKIQVNEYYCKNISPFCGM
ncbi:hypothetical protein AVEN_193249-1 [Araneus ventricosus]|uniref:Uncharacterized protein n=1 Tax=Araneus ventricosus TaxID=182803 RepID=A0A4Y2HMQ5_ARAVE|nr:hypothetical protein AVEN_193249-1 [Araneus ventricosus]